MIFDPLASVVLGVTLLQEDLHETTGGAIASLLGALAAMAAGLVVLRAQPGAAASTRALSAPTPPGLPLSPSAPRVRACA